MYIVDPAAQARRLAELTPIDEAEDERLRFRDPKTGEEWLLYHALGRLPGRGPRLLRRVSPDLELHDRLAACFGSNRRDDLIGLAWDLSESPEAWAPAIEWLEGQPGLAPEQVELFLGNITIVGAVNRRPAAGRQVGDVLADFRRFSRLAERARRLVAARPGPRRQGVDPL
jgi:hypothetical protein